ncbi:hypothetical protein MTO96_038262 [Rhipicephalus appendiculatus]
MASALRCNVSTNTASITEERTDARAHTYHIALNGEPQDVEMTFDRLRGGAVVRSFGLCIYILATALRLTWRRPAELAEADENLIAKKRVKGVPRNLISDGAPRCALVSTGSVFPADNPTATMHQTETNYRALREAATKMDRGARLYWVTLFANRGVPSSDVGLIEGA